ncbi:MAG: type II toxin-antitoxin system RelE/ParE family toxin [Terracidiphilus sp.]
MIDVREYVDSNGHNHYREWASTLDPSVRVRVDKAVFRLAEGNFSSVKPEGGGVSAIRLDFGPGYRVYFANDGDRLVILLAGGSKRRQQMDIQAARRLWSEYKGRKRMEG